MTNKYRTGGWSQDGLIVKVEIEKETDKSVWIKGRRSAKQSRWENYYNSFDEAKEALTERSNRKLEAIKSNLMRAGKEAKEISELEP